MLALITPQSDKEDGRWKSTTRGAHQLLVKDRKPVFFQVLSPSSAPSPDMSAARKEAPKETNSVKQEQPLQPAPCVAKVVTSEGPLPVSLPMTVVTTAGGSAEVCNTVNIPSTVTGLPASIANSLSSILTNPTSLSLTNLLGMPSPQVGTVQLGQAGLTLAQAAAPLSDEAASAATTNSSMAVVYALPQQMTLGSGITQVITSAMGPLMAAESADIKPQLGSLGTSAGTAASHSPAHSPNAASSVSDSFSPPVTPMSQGPDSPESPYQVGQQQSQQQHAGGGKVRARRTLSGGKEEKICGVCGAKALGCNFDAISCESCKAFFRRNALRNQHKCLFKGECEITVNTRRFCQHCRLKKCFAIGMKSELILGDDDKKKRAMKVQDNRKNRKPAEGTATTATSGWQQAVEQVFQAAVTQDTPPPPPPQTPTLAAEGTSQEPNPLAEQEPLSEVGVEGLPNTCNLLTISKHMRLNESTIPSHLDTYLLRRLTEYENLAIQELVQVYDLSFTVDLEPLIHIKQLDPSLNQLVNQSSITVLRLIKFAKRLEDFVRLPQDCQIGILKGTWIHILLLRSVALYDTERDVWVTPRGDIPTEILKNATGFVQLHDDHVCYCKSIKQIIRDDLTIVVVLLVIVLFSPEGPHVITREVVSNLQDKYLLLLKHYLESKYTYTRAAEMFPQLMSKMKELKELAEVHGKYLLNVNPREIEPIMLEILDLK